MIFKPNSGEMSIIKSVAFRGCSPVLPSLQYVSLEPRIHVNVSDDTKPVHMNAALVSNEVKQGWGDCDLHDFGQWSAFVAGVSWTLRGMSNQPMTRLG